MENVQNAIFEPPDFKIFWEKMPRDPPTNLVPLSFIFKSPHLKIRSAVSYSGVQDSPPCVSITQHIYIDRVLSSNVNLKFGVPQGSFLGPLLFFLYVSKLFKIIESHLPNSHCYADDTQLYIAFRSGNDLEETAAITAMESCIADISQWMHSHTCQLSWFSRESPSFSSNLSVSRLEYQISQIKWTFEHFCALV